MCKANGAVQSAEHIVRQQHCPRYLSCKAMSAVHICSLMQDVIDISVCYSSTLPHRGKESKSGILMANNIKMHTFRLYSKQQNWKAESQRPVSLVKIETELLLSRLESLPQPVLNNFSLMHKRYGLCWWRGASGKYKKECKYHSRGERKLGNECINQNAGIGYESQRTNETHNGGITKEAIQAHDNTANDQVHLIKMAVSKCSSGHD